MNINFLRIPLQKLNFIDDIKSFEGLSADEISTFKTQYDPEEIASIVDAVKWAANNPDYDFRSLLLPPKPSQTNEEIYDYLCLVDGSFEVL